MLRQFYKRHRRKIKHFDGFLVNNTVLERGLVIAPVIVAANTMRNSLILGLSFILITFFTVVLSSFVPKALPYTIRVILYVVLASLLFIPTAYLMEQIFAESVARVGFFLPLLVTNSLIVTKSETRFLKKRRLPMMLDVFSHTLGFMLVIAAAGAIRELFGNGTLMGNAIDLPSTFYVMMLPFGGFILLGFMSAIVQRFRLYLESEEDTGKPYPHREKGGLK